MQGLFILPEHIEHLPCENNALVKHLQIIDNNGFLNNLIDTYIKTQINFWSWSPDLFYGCCCRFLIWRPGISRLNWSILYSSCARMLCRCCSNPEVLVRFDCRIFCWMSGSFNSILLVFCLNNSFKISNCHENMECMFLLFNY